MGRLLHEALRQGKDMEGLSCIEKGYNDKAVYAEGQGQRGW